MWTLIVAQGCLGRAARDRWRATSSSTVLGRKLPGHYEQVDAHRRNVPPACIDRRNDNAVDSGWSHRHSVIMADFGSEVAVADSVVEPL